jgi:transposase
MRKPYSTDLSDAEWSCIEPHLPTPKATGRPRVHTLREVLNAIFYIVRSGCAWRLLPHDFPPWKTIHHYFRAWRIDGTWTKVARRPARAGTSASYGQRSSTQRRRHRRQPVGQEYRRGRRAARIRWRQEGEGAKAPFTCGYAAGLGAQS